MIRVHKFNGSYGLVIYKAFCLDVAQGYMNGAPPKV